MQPVSVRHKGLIRWYVVCNTHRTVTADKFGRRVECKRQQTENVNETERFTIDGAVRRLLLPKVPTPEDGPSGMPFKGCRRNQARQLYRTDAGVVRRVIPCVVCSAPMFRHPTAPRRAPRPRFPPPRRPLHPLIRFLRIRFFKDSFFFLLQDSLFCC